MFTVPEPTDNWEDEINEESEVICKNALVDESVVGLAVAGSKWESNLVFQFERVGYFVVDNDTTKGNIVFNQTVGLKEDSAKGKGGGEKKVDAAAQAKKDAQNEIKRKREERNKLTEAEFFMKAEEFAGKFSKYDDTGFPTHTADGEALTKSAGKKLKKELDKHKKARSKK